MLRFEDYNISPMLLSKKEPFNSKDYLYELKLDGIRAVIFINQDFLRINNKRNKDVTNLYPELKNITSCVSKKIILDGEIIALKNNKPDFFEIQKRSLMTSNVKIKLHKIDICFVAYDILYLDKDITQLPLIERKKLLSDNVIEKNNLSISRYIFENGIDFYNLVLKEGLEGIVAKKIDSLYYEGIKSKDWFKIKVLEEEDLYICGYDFDNDLAIVCLNEFSLLTLRGKIYIPKTSEKEYIKSFCLKNKVKKAWFSEYNNVCWVKLYLVGSVSYMHLTESGHMRQAVWKGLRSDK